MSIFYRRERMKVILSMEMPMICDGKDKSFYEALGFEFEAYNTDDYSTVVFQTKKNSVELEVDSLQSLTHLLKEVGRLSLMYDKTNDIIEVEINNETYYV
jgi:UDP:flavonoid glycosyltransferase YjiC (YdhE family)